MVGQLVFDLGTGGVLGIATEVDSVFRDIGEKLQGIAVSQDSEEPALQL